MREVKNCVFYEQVGRYCGSKFEALVQGENVRQMVVIVRLMKVVLKAGARVGFPVCIISAKTYIYMYYSIKNGHLF